MSFEERRTEIEGKRKQNKTYDVVDKGAMGGDDGIKGESDTLDLGVESVRKLDVLCRFDVVDHPVELHHVRRRPEHLLDWCCPKSPCQPKQRKKVTHSKIKENCLLERSTTPSVRLCPFFVPMRRQLFLG